MIIKFSPFIRQHVWKRHPSNKNKSLTKKTKNKGMQVRTHVLLDEWLVSAMQKSNLCYVCDKCLFGTCRTHCSARMSWNQTLSAAIASLLFVSIWLLRYGSTCKVVWKKRIIAKRRIRISFWIQFTSKIENMSLSGLYQTVLTCSLQ